MKIMDRYLFVNFIIAYLICFISMVGLYIIIDLFANADEFMEDGANIGLFIHRATKYYYVHGFEYFARLSPIITMIAAMTTLAALHRHNEIVALLAAGIPTRRALVPILGGTALMIALGIANREVALPYYSEMLQRLHDDIDGERNAWPAMHMDKDQILYRAEAAYREDQRLENVNITLPMEVVGQLQEIHAPIAYHRVDPETNRPGWLLEKSTPVQIVRPNEKIKRLDDGSVFIFSNVTFLDMIQTKNWMNFASTASLVAQLQNEEVKNPQSVRILIHNRMMQPLLHIILVLIGIPFVLQWEQRNIYRSIAISMLISLSFFIVDACSGYFAEYGYLDPVMAAWLPVLLFGPLALALFHQMGT